jgi:hypothetical protein
MERIRTNEDFYRNLQWKSDEDITTFLKDQSGQDRNRITFTMNMIRQLVEQYRGNATRMKMSFTAKNVSPFSITRREEALAQHLFFHEQAEKNPYFAAGLKKRLLLGDTKEESIGLFNNAYVDDLAKGISALLREVAEMNEFDDIIQIFIAEQLAFSGLGVVHDFEYGGKQRFTALRTEDFFWDRDNSRRPDLQDSEYMGYVDYMNAPQILESTVLPLEEQAKKNIENYDKRVGNSYFGQSPDRSGQPVVMTVWRDTQPIWYGYVKDEFGQPFFTKINWVEEGEDAPRYTDADLIEPPKTIFAKRHLRGKNKVRIDVDNMRFCRFVPYQASSNTYSSDKNAENIDIVLDYGMLPYQDNTFENYANVNYPFKCWAWSYIKGEVSSPIEDAINPQRFLNRVLSATENQINNSGGAGVAYDADLMEDQDEATVTSNINQGKPLAFSAKGKGMNNAIGTYNAGVQGSTYQMFNIIPVLKGLVQGSTGINDAMMGESQGQDQLVGVTDALLQQGSILQAPFYHALMMIMKQMYQGIANRGKKIYIDNQRQLINAVGDYNAEVITLSKDAMIEDFRLFVELEENPKQLMQAANQMLLLFRQQNLIDKTRFGNLFGRSMPDDVFRAVREFSGEQVIVDKQVAKQNEDNMKAMAENQQRLEAKADQEKTNDQAFQLTMQKEKLDSQRENIGIKAATRTLYQQPPTPLAGGVPKNK